MEKKKVFLEKYAQNVFLSCILYTLAYVSFQRKEKNNKKKKTNFGFANKRCVNIYL